MAFIITYDAWIISLIAFGVTSISSLIRSAVLDKDKLKEHKEKIKEHQANLKEATKKGDTKKAQKIQGELLDVTMQNLKHGMKPMMYTMLPIILIFGWVRKHYAGIEWVVQLGGFQLGWFGWYFINAILISSILNKLLKLT